MICKLTTAVLAAAALAGTTFATTGTAFAWGEDYGYAQGGYAGVHYQPVHHKVCQRVLTYDRYGNPCWEVSCHYE